MKKAVTTIISTIFCAALYLVRDIAIETYKQAAYCVKQGKERSQGIHWEEDGKISSKFKVVGRAVALLAAGVLYTVVTGVAQGVLNAIHDTVDYVKHSRAVDADFIVVPENIKETDEMMDDGFDQFCDFDDDEEVKSDIV